MENNYIAVSFSDTIEHFGVKGMKWGVRTRYTLDRIRNRRYYKKRLKEAKRKAEEARKRQVWYNGPKIYTTNGKSSINSTTSSSSIYSAYSDRSSIKNSDDNDDFNDYINFKQ